MTGRVTMLGISRWTEQGGSYRTVQRFFNTAVAWSQVHWLLIKTHLLQTQATYLEQRIAHPLHIGQVLRPETPAEPVPARPRQWSSGAAGAPRAARTAIKPMSNSRRTSSFSLTLLQAVRQLLGTTLAVTYVVLDGAFGNNYALQMVRRCGYDLISKLAVNSASALPEHRQRERIRPDRHLQATGRLPGAGDR